MFGEKVYFLPGCLATIVCLEQWCSSAIVSIPVLFFLSSSYLLSTHPTDCHDDAYEGDAYGGDGDGEERKECTICCTIFTRYNALFLASL